MKSKLSTGALALLIVIVSAGCSGGLPSLVNDRPQPAPQATSQAAESLPSAQPLVSPAESPVAVPTAALKVTPFQIDRPVRAGARSVTGTGPAGVPVVLQDVNFTDLILGTTVIGNDGKFEFKLTDPLQANRRIGITVGNLEGTGFQEEQFQDPGFNGPEARLVPQVAFLFDTALVQ